MPASDELLPDWARPLPAFVERFRIDLRDRASVVPIRRADRLCGAGSGHDEA